MLDLPRGIEYLDKELDQLFPPEGNTYKPRYVDKLAKVYTRQGAEEWVLVHIEVQGYRDNQFARRMFQYYTRIWDKYDRSIVSFAIFTDSERSFHPSVFEQSFLGTSLCYKFNTYKVMDQSATALAESSNPFAILVLTVQAALSNGNGLSERKMLDLKVNIVKQLLAKQISEAKVSKIMSFLRYYIRFENQEMNDNFEKEVDVINRNRVSMGIEEFLLDKAKQEGKELAKQELVKDHLLKGRFSPEQIAEIFNVPIVFVLSIKEDMDAGDKMA